MSPELWLSGRCNRPAKGLVISDKTKGWLLHVTQAGGGTNRRVRSGCKGITW